MQVNIEKSTSYVNKKPAICKAKTEMSFLVNMQK